ncbi:hypothetical protein GCM10027422_05690 [Hymenobacter arcticus]
MTETSITAFDRARTGLWASLQKHLTLIYQAEAAFVKAVAFTDSFPFLAAEVEPELLAEYHRQHRALRDLFIDETTQLDTLAKAIRTKTYADDEKKQLYLLLLGYLDIAALVFGRLATQVPVRQPKDEEQEATQARFERVRSLARLQVKGVAGLLR